jgi:hypothetical protein
MMWDALRTRFAHDGPETIAETLDCKTGFDSSIMSNWFIGQLCNLTWHSLGSSLTAFSTAKFRDALFFDISTLQFGQVAT